MKITHTTDLSSLLPTTSSISSKPQKHRQHPCPRNTHPDLPIKPADRKPTRRRILTARTPRVRPRKVPAAAGAPGLGGGSKRAGPPTPLLRWKFDEVEETDLVNGENLPEGVDEHGGGGERKLRRNGKPGGEAVSARKLASALWRLRASEFGGDERREERRRSRKNEDQSGFKVDGAANVSDRLTGHPKNRGVCNETKDLLPRSPCSVNGPVNGYTCEPQAPFQLSNYAMEGVTKWDPIRFKPPKERFEDTSQQKNLKVSNLQDELNEAKLRIEELESERRASKKKLEQFLKKLSEERAAWRRREHEKVREIMDDMKSDLSRERKNRQKLEIVNSKLVSELTESKQSANRLLQELEKETNNRELMEEVCDDLAKEIEDGKEEVDALKSERSRIREEVDDERRMLQMAEVWREERVQMKLIDAKVTLEDKCAQMNVLVTELERFLQSHGVTLDPNRLRHAGMLLEVAGSVKIHDIKELTYEPPKSNDIYSVFEEMAMMAEGGGGETSEREIESCVVADDSPATHHSSKIHTVSPEEAMTLGEDKIYRFSKGCGGSQNGNKEDDDDDDDRSGWETMSQADDQGCSSYSGDGSNGSVSNKKMMIAQRDSSDVSETRWEEKRDNETLITEISEVCSVQKPKPPQQQQQQSSKVKSVSRLWKPSSYLYNNNNDGNCNKQQFMSMEEGKISNGRISYGGGGVVMSPEKGDLAAGQWCLSSPDSWSGNHAGGRGRKGGGGCIEWPRGGGHKSSLKAKLMEARMESQKVQLRQVLKQKF